jgi:hypothetical protein
MHVMIDISEEEFEIIKNSNRPLYYAEHLIKNGTPLPKGHGNLKDELDLDLSAPSLGTDEYVDDLMAKHNIDYANGDDEDKVKAFALDLIDSCMNVIETAPTIIEPESEG